jgi:hypothetical protein
MKFAMRLRECRLSLDSAVERRLSAKAVNVSAFAYKSRRGGGSRSRLFGFAVPIRIE